MEIASDTRVLRATPLSPTNTATLKITDVNESLGEARGGGGGGGGKEGGGRGGINIAGAPFVEQLRDPAVDGYSALDSHASGCEGFRSWWNLMPFSHSPPLPPCY